MLLEQVEAGSLVDEPHDLQIGRCRIDLRRDRQQDDRKDAEAVLAGGLRDELLDPVGQAHDVGAVGDQAELVAPRRTAGDRRGQDERRVAGAVDRDLEQARLRLVEELGDVGAGEAGGDQAEGGERRVAPAHGRVGVEDAVAGGTGRGIQRRARVGDDHDPLGRVDAQIPPGGLEGALGGVGFDGRAGLGRHHQDGLRQAARLGVAVDRGEHLTGGGRVEDDERNARSLGDHLGRERRSAHARQDDPRDALRPELVAQGDDLRHERPRDADGLDPAQATGCLVLGGGSPQGRVAGRDTRSHQFGHEAGERCFHHRLDVAAQVDGEGHPATLVDAASASATVSLSSCQETMNFDTPSSSSTWVTSAKSTPTAASWSNTPWASA